MIWWCGGYCETFRLILAWTSAKNTSYTQITDYYKQWVRSVGQELKLYPLFVASFHTKQTNIRVSIQIILLADYKVSDSYYSNTADIEEVWYICCLTPSYLLRYCGRLLSYQLLGLHSKLFVASQKSHLSLRPLDLPCFTHYLEVCHHPINNRHVH